MDSDMKFFLWIMALIVLVPLAGLIFDNYQTSNCRMELAKIGKSVEEIKKICK